MKDFQFVPDVERGTNIDIDVKPGVIGMFTVPVRWTVQGDGWKLAGHGRMTIGHEWCGQITQWAFCGPFHNETRNVLDENAVHGPERRLDLAAQYDTLAGKRGWTTVRSQDRFHRNVRQAEVGRRLRRGRIAGEKADARHVHLQRSRQQQPEPSLNGLPWRVPNHYGKSSAMLKAGENVLMVKLVNIDKNWSLEARMHIAGWASPGDVEIVPVEKFDSVAALHPAARPAIPAGRSLPFAGGVDWKLAYDDDFNRARLGSDWDYGPGSWAEHKFRFGNGVIVPTDEMHSFLTYMHKVDTPFRVEYDVKGVGGCCSGGVADRSNEVGIFCGIEDRPVGYRIQSGAAGLHHCARQNKWPRPRPAPASSQTDGATWWCNSSGRRSPFSSMANRWLSSTIPIGLSAGIRSPSMATPGIHRRSPTCGFTGPLAGRFVLPERTASGSRSRWASRHCRRASGSRLL